FVNEQEFPAEDVGIAHEISAPELIAEHRDALGIFTGRRVGGNEPAAFESWNAEVTRGIGGDGNGLQVFGKVASGCCQVPPIQADDAFHAVSLAKLIELWAAQ